MSAPDRRPGRRRLIDPRLLIGLGLVLASVAGVVGVVAAADATTPVYAAAKDLAPGERVRHGDLVQRSVVLDGAAEHYLAPGDVPSEGLVVVRPVAGGELIPGRALQSAFTLDSASVVLAVDGRLGTAIRSGARVDVWAAAESTSGAGAAQAPTDDGAVEAGADPVAGPVVLAADAVVVEVLRDEGLVAAGGGVSVEVQVSRDRLGGVLQAVADGLVLSLVPADPGKD